MDLKDLEIAALKSELARLERLANFLLSIPTPERQAYVTELNSYETRNPATGAKSHHGV